MKTTAPTLGELKLEAQFLKRAEVWQPHQTGIESFLLLWNNGPGGLLSWLFLNKGNPAYMGPHPHHGMNAFAC